MLQRVERQLAPMLPGLGPLAAMERSMLRSLTLEVRPLQGCTVRAFVSCAAVCCAE